MFSSSPPNLSRWACWAIWMSKQDEPKLWLSRSAHVWIQDQMLLKWIWVKGSPGQLEITRIVQLCSSRDTLGMFARDGYPNCRDVYLPSCAGGWSWPTSKNTNWTASRQRTWFMPSWIQHVSCACELLLGRWTPWLNSFQCELDMFMSCMSSQSGFCNLLERFMLNYANNVYISFQSGFPICCKVPTTPVFEGFNKLWQITAYWS